MLFVAAHHLMVFVGLELKEITEQLFQGQMTLTIQPLILLGQFYMILALTAPIAVIITVAIVRRQKHIIIN